MKEIQFRSTLLKTFVLLATFFQAGCSIFLGNVRPVEQKSSSYEILNLTQLNSNWKKITSTDPGSSDLTFQSSRTASIISINSACKDENDSPTRKSLKELTRELLLGISEISFQEEALINLSQTPGLKTTLKGKLNNEIVMFRTVVLQKLPCIYDLIYISTPENFTQEEKNFESFISSLQLK